MKTLKIKKSEVPYTEFVKRSAYNADFDTLITESTMLVDAETNELKAVYKELDFDDSEILWALDRIRFEVSDRSAGLKTTSRVFGFLPRVKMRRDFCTATSLAKEHPQEHAVICKYGLKIGSLYEEYNGELFKRHMELVHNKVLDEYTIKETPFTSGIVNKNNPLKYHFDSGNFKGVYSMMAVFKKDVEGGYLSCPEYNVGFELKHNSVFLFEGQSMLHGVTPIKRLTPRAARYSIVYYSMQQMWQCLPLDDEVARIREIKTAREKKRYQRLVADKAEL